MKLYDDVILLWSESKSDISYEINQFQKIAAKRIVWNSCCWRYNWENTKLRLYCKDICHQYKAYKSSYEGSYYVKGYKRCIECETFLQWDGLRCPCCGRILRTKPHNTISKGKLRLKKAYLERYLIKWLWINVKKEGKYSLLIWCINNAILSA